jgi:hypothetical protein
MTVELLVKSPSKAVNNTTVKKSEYFTFTGIFKKFETKASPFGEDLFGFILEDIRELPHKSVISSWQWFNMTEKFKAAFENHKDEALPGKKIQFEGHKESNKKGYYTYRGNVLISNPEDLEYRILRPKNIQVL